MDDKDLVFGLQLKQWEASFRPGIVEFAASNFTFTPEADGQLRIAFGNLGPYINTAGERAPVFTHAVTLQPQLAVELARLILKSFAEPATTRTKSSEQL